ncbi:hypothetical protein I551_4378 [Mycobacterium ulcerans str. Harvey]|uniref:Uncharacterized protein n=1 Tax=Mycobacterium ulcerans str. Harvey TaxID=1299332 RepID=A0ABP3ACN6_MYCUL|nr:hypothetical protein I551_4378 [Mycobacterium ulcerans str. Harvey]
MTSTSMCPVLSMTSDTTERTAVSSVTSSAKVSTPGIGAKRCGAREVPTTRNPALASRTAMAAPMPEDTPVISATGGVDVIGVLSLVYTDGST